MGELVVHLPEEERFEEHQLPMEQQIFNRMVPIMRRTICLAFSIKNIIKGTVDNLLTLNLRQQVAVLSGSLHFTEIWHEFKRLSLDIEDLFLSNSRSRVEKMIKLNERKFLIFLRYHEDLGENIYWKKTLHPAEKVKQKWGPNKIRLEEFLLSTMLHPDFMKNIHEIGNLAPYYQMGKNSSVREVYQQDYTLVWKHGISQNPACHWDSKSELAPGKFFQVRESSEGDTPNYRKRSPSMESRGYNPQKEKKSKIQEQPKKEQTPKKGPSKNRQKIEEIQILDEIRADKQVEPFKKPDVKQPQVLISKLPIAAAAPEIKLTFCKSPENNRTTWKIQQEPVADILATSLEENDIMELFESQVEKPAEENFEDIEVLECDQTNLFQELQEHCEQEEAGTPANTVTEDFCEVVSMSVENVAREVPKTGHVVAEPEVDLVKLLQTRVEQLEQRTTRYADDMKEWMAEKMMNQDQIESLQKDVEKLKKEQVLMEQEFTRREEELKKQLGEELATVDGKHLVKEAGLKHEIREIKEAMEKQTEKVKEIYTENYINSKQHNIISELLEAASEAKDKLVQARIDVEDKVERWF